ncbi:unnamed protein product [Protopolystoma xenopodis]|uniref:Uncharacterized protein n=1 Tax=Protopolystoma xenopodis TaxID=117903 RepID=A0A3S5B7E5_9PLAT|nr:unnamed protein product [Protopolystoma xenopodis]
MKSACESKSVSLACSGREGRCLRETRRSTEKFDLEPVVLRLDLSRYGTSRRGPKPGDRAWPRLYGIICQSDACTAKHPHEGFEIG